jgi:hypothetical protein
VGGGAQSPRANNSIQRHHHILYAKALEWMISHDPMRLVPGELFMPSHGPGTPFGTFIEPFFIAQLFATSTKKRKQLFAFSFSARERESVTQEYNIHHQNVQSLSLYC